MKTEIISLGSNCSIAYQLATYNLRYNAYPFDHVKIPSFKILNKVLKNNFDSYIEFIIKENKTCYEHIINDDFNNNINNTTILKNKYNIIFPHDCSSNISYDLQIENIKEKYNRRIERFRNINHPVIFIWNEPLIVLEKNIIDFHNIIKQYTTNYLLIIINHKEITTTDINKTIIINNDKEFINWKQDNIDWAYIFGMRTRIKMLKTQSCSQTIHPLLKNKLLEMPDNTVMQNIIKIKDQIYINESYQIDNYQFNINHFGQSNELMHDTIKNIINKNIILNSNYIGFAGLSSYYAFINKNKLLNIKCYTNTQCIYESGIINNIDITLTKSYNIKFNEMNTVLLINTSNLDEQLFINANNNQFKQIIYITCNETRERKNKLLLILNNYQINKKYKLITLDFPLTIYFFNYNQFYL